MRLASLLVPLVPLVLLACGDKDEDPDTSGGDGEDGGGDGGTSDGGTTTDDGGSTGIDADSDGYAQGEDCNDEDASIHPGADEFCDGVDEDCDGAIDNDPQDGTSGWQDADADGYGDPSAPLTSCDPDGIVANDGDCDDGDDAVSPDATEVCDSAATDEDCDGLADDADNSVDPATMSTFYADSDADGYGDADSPVQACSQPTDAVADDSDCDDTDASLNPDNPCPTSWEGAYSGKMSLDATIKEFGVTDTCSGTLDATFDSSGSATGSGTCNFAGLLLPYGTITFTLSGSADYAVATANGGLSGTVAGVAAHPDWDGVFSGSSPMLLDGTFSGSETSGGYNIAYGGSFSLSQ